MHSDDPNKEDKKFQEEVDTILRNAGEGEADFWGFFFPSSLYSGREFTAKCLFVNVTFMKDADFSCARFKKDVNFGQATFCRHASFQGATFQQGAYFSFAKFPMVADFRQTIFGGAAEFRETVFRGDRTLDRQEGQTDALLGRYFGWRALGSPKQLRSIGPIWGTDRFMGVIFQKSFFPR